MNGDRRGFSLLEILVVLAILGLGLALVTSMMRNSAEYSQRVEEDVAAQLACDNMMSSILAGDMTATLGVETPIPDAPNWTVKTELLDGPLESLVAVRITARRYPSYAAAEAASRSGASQSSAPTSGRSFVVKEWARRADVRSRVARIAADGSFVEVDSEGTSTLGGTLNGGAENAEFQWSSGNLFDALDSEGSAANAVGGAL